MEGKETIKDVLERLAATNESTEKDDVIVEYVLHKIGFEKAKVTCGIVYFNPPFEPPQDIHSVAKTIIETVK